jgi:hypothetical protein
MDGKGAWRDNVFVERLWRTVKYEEVYLLAYDIVSDARASRAAAQSPLAISCATGDADQMSRIEAYAASGLLYVPRILSQKKWITAKLLFACR